MKDSRSTARGQAASEIMSELRVSGHLMRLDPGLFCVVQTPTPGANPGSGLPGVRLSLAPGASSGPDLVRISGFETGGWLSGTGDAALIRVSGGPAQVLVTIYQARETPDGIAPNLQVMRLLDSGGAVPARSERIAAASTLAAKAKLEVMEVVAHIQGRGDQGAMLGQWLGERGSKRWIEGFGIAPTKELALQDIEYQAVLGRDWLSPWVEGGQFCGSRGMALPVLGLRVRLRGGAAARYRVSYSATFVDGSQVGPVFEGAPCEAAGLAAMESFCVEVKPRVAATGKPTRKAAPKHASVPVQAVQPPVAKAPAVSKIAGKAKR